MICAPHLGNRCGAFPRSLGLHAERIGRIAVNPPKPHPLFVGEITPFAADQDADGEREADDHLLTDALSLFGIARRTLDVGNHLPGEFELSCEQILEHCGVGSLRHRPPLLSLQGLAEHTNFHQGIQGK